MTPDVNVLIYATRPEYRQHAAAEAWLRTAVRAATRAAPFTVLPAVVVGYVRLVTDRRAHPEPTPTAEALANVADLLEQPNVRLATHGDEWPRVVELCDKHRLAGRILGDAWIAASVLQLNEHLVTFDRDFRRLLPPRHLTILSA
ncbi:ribonuclease VapC43 [Gemmatimonadetes bacterium T265]|nr:ribonuclease VapC43 [Gemmatimonadetes bacterium T265]